MLARVAVAEGASPTLAAEAALIKRQTIYRRAVATPRCPKPIKAAPVIEETVVDPFRHSVEEAIVIICRRRVAFGYRRVWAMLRRAGYKVNRKRVHRLMKAWGFLRVAKRRHPKRQGRPFDVTKPNELWQTDLTAVWCGEDGWAYMTAVVDTYCRSILGWTFTRRCRAQDVIGSLEQAWALAWPYGRPDDQPRVVLRHDNGTQFTSYLSRDVAAALDVKLSRTAYRHPDGNAFIERTFLSLKTECVWPEEFETFEQAQEAIAAWVVHFNTERPHQSLGYATPEEVRRASIGNPTLTAA